MTEPTLASPYLWLWWSLPLPVLTYEKIMTEPTLDRPYLWIDYDGAYLDPPATLRRWPSGDPPAATLRRPSDRWPSDRRPSNWRPRIEHEIFVNRTNKFCVKCTYYGWLIETNLNFGPVKILKGRKFLKWYYKTKTVIIIKLKGDSF